MEGMESMRALTTICERKCPTPGVECGLMTTTVTHLHALPTGDRPQWPQCSQSPQGPEGCQVGVVLHCQTEDGNLTVSSMNQFF